MSRANPEMSACKARYSEGRVFRRKCLDDRTPRIPLPSGKNRDTYVAVRAHILGVLPMVGLTTPNIQGTPTVAWMSRSLLHRRSVGGEEWAFEADLINRGRGMDVLARILLREAGLARILLRDGKESCAVLAAHYLGPARSVAKVFVCRGWESAGCTWIVVEPTSLPVHENPGWRPIFVKWHRRR